jgi:hypothetical protein
MFPNELFPFRGPLEHALGGRGSTSAELLRTRGWRWRGSESEERQEAAGQEACGGGGGEQRELHAGPMSDFAATGFNSKQPWFGI